MMSFVLTHTALLTSTTTVLLFFLLYIYAIFDYLSRVELVILVGKGWKEKEDQLVEEERRYCYHLNDNGGWEIWL